MANCPPAKARPEEENAETPPQGQGRHARPGTKSAHVITLLRKSKGATLTELMKATGWPAHSVRGFLSGMLRKKMGLKIESAKRGDGERAYSISR